LAYAADLPTPADAVKALASGGSVPAARPAAAPPSAPSSGGSARAVSNGAPAPAVSPAPRPQHEPVAQATPPQLATFPEVVALFEQKREARLATHLKMHVRLVRFEPGVIEFNPAKGAPPDIAGQIGKFLTQWTGQRWVVSVVNTAGKPTLYEQQIEQAKAIPVVKALLDAYPDADVSLRRAEDK
jgi:DNA polymerase-3 subunit gamma/tau